MPVVSTIELKVGQRPNWPIVPPPGLSGKNY